MKITLAVFVARYINPTSLKAVKLNRGTCTCCWQSLFFAGKKRSQAVLFSPDIEDITRWREDMNFMFEWQEQYLTSAYGIYGGIHSAYGIYEWFSSQ